MRYKGIILAGGAGTRLSPITEFVCKQLLPIYDKPLIYYPLTMMLLGGITEILIISTPEAVPVLSNAIGNGSRFGINIKYAVQETPKGIAEAFIIAEQFLKGTPCTLILGDNIINKSHFGDFFLSAMRDNYGSTIFGFPVKNPHHFGVVEISPDNGQVISIEEKPQTPKSNIAAIGLYIYDETVTERVKNLKPSLRGELEITDLNKSYLEDKKLHCKLLSRGDFWADAGSPDRMNDCSNYVRMQQNYTNLMVGSPEEAAFHAGLISQSHLKSLIKNMKRNNYSEYLSKIVNQDD